MTQLAHRAGREEIQAREGRFLVRYIESILAGLPARTDTVRESAVNAGYTEQNAKLVAVGVLQRYVDAPFVKTCDAIGLNKPLMAVVLRKALMDDDTNAKEKVAIIKLLLSNLGEKTEDQRSTVNISSPKALVVVGATKRQLAAMTEPKQIQIQGESSVEVEVG